jgi:cytochrome c5
MNQTDKQTTMHHEWDHANEKRLAASDSPDGCARNERTCMNCHMVKITVIPPHGYPWTQWRTRDGQVWVGEATPPCIVVPKAAAKIVREVA